MKKIKFRKNFEQLRRKFQLSIFNESTLENVFSLRVSLLDGIFIVASAFIIFFFLSLFLVAHTPMKTFLPDNIDPKLRKQFVENAYRVDSLSDVMYKQTKYINVLREIVSGEIPVDSLKKKGKNIPLDTMANRHLELMKTTENEKEFRKNYESSEKYNLSVMSKQPKVEALSLHKPVIGKILTHFNPTSKCFGVDIQISDRQPTLAIMDGTVLFSGYTSDFDYVIQVQHKNDYLSVYKFNTESFKKQGDKVKAGETIGMVGKNRGKEGFPHLYFELWHKGVALNPEEYIVF